MKLWSWLITRQLDPVPRRFDLFEYLSLAHFHLLLPWSLCYHFINIFFCSGQLHSDSPKNSLILQSASFIYQYLDPIFKKGKKKRKKKIQLGSDCMHEVCIRIQPTTPCCWLALKIFVWLVLQSCRIFILRWFVYSIEWFTRYGMQMGFWCSFNYAPVTTHKKEEKSCNFYKRETKKNAVKSEKWLKIGIFISLSNSPRPYKLSNVNKDE